MSGPSADIPTITAAELRERLTGRDELALLDAREEMAFGNSHILYASCLALSRLEILAPRLVPRRGTDIVVCDAGEGVALRAAARLMHFGYQRVSVLEGGIDAWQSAGYELFSGVNVPSKAFGEIIEHECDTPSVSADELKQMMDAGEDMVVLDSRPMNEYRVRNIPTGTCVPGAELAYRVHDMATSPDTLVVVNCAGRTRSIIGAQSLINAGIPNRVVALRNGTMGWHLAGHGLEQGMERRPPNLSPEGLRAAQACAARVADRFDVRRIDVETLREWRAQSDDHALFVLDVRSPEEYQAGHLPGSRSAPGGQLVQETDMFVGTLRARVVLIDDTGVRATMTASWLNQMGWRNVVVLDDGLAGVEPEHGPEPRDILGFEDIMVEMIDPRDLHKLVESQAVTVIDLGPSRDYKRAHVPGARFAVRARLADTLHELDVSKPCVLTSEDGVIAELAAEELAAMLGTDVRVLRGGNAAWRETVLPTESGGAGIADDPDDIWLRPYEKDWGVEQAMQDYLTWEVALVPQIARDGTAQWLP